MFVALGSLPTSCLLLWCFRLSAWCSLMASSALFSPSLSTVLLAAAAPVDSQFPPSAS